MRKYLIFLALIIVITVLAACTTLEFPIFSVVFNSNGGNEIETIKIKGGSDIAKPTDPVKSGFIFGGWYTDESLKEEKEWVFYANKVSSNIILYAKWYEESTVIYYTINFATNGGSPVEPITVISGHKIEKPQDPEWEGLIFNNWYISPTLLNSYKWDFTKNTVTSNLTLFASWEDEYGEICH